MPARLRDIRRAAELFGISVTEPNSGSHWLLRRQGVRVYTVPAHNGLRSEISDVYIRALCRHFGIDEDEFRSKL